MDFETLENYVSNHLKLFISMVAGIVVFAGLIAAVVFFIALRGAEQTMVPDVRGQDLTSALLEFQVKELYPRIQLRYSQTSADKGLILGQDPVPGTIVKAGRRIRLVVSQGVMINTVENYLGRNIEEVRMDIQTLYAAEGGGPPLITLKQPIMYQFSAEAPGTILEQRPEAGAGISGPVALEMVVSRGPEDALVKIPDLMGLTMDEALEQIGITGIDFTFTLKQALPGETPETVADQNPSGGVMVKSGTRVNIVLLSPPARASQRNASPGEVFGLFRYDMAKNPYPLSLRLEAQLPGGERRRLLAVEYPGGPLAVPYKLPLNTVIVLYMLNREIHRETVIPQPESLSLDQL
jgi:beta-lactam-binding protein with PASTA domain